MTTRPQQIVITREGGLITGKYQSVVIIYINAFTVVVELEYQLQSISLFKNYIFILISTLTISRAKKCKQTEFLVANRL